MCLKVAGAQEKFEDLFSFELLSHVCQVHEPIDVLVCKPLSTNTGIVLSQDQHCFQ